MGNPVLIGHYDYTLDAKNRLVVPSRFRELLTQEKASHFVLAKGRGDCVMLFLPSQWENFMNLFEEQARALKDKTGVPDARRELFANAEEVELDEQGRVLVSEKFKSHAGLRKDVVIIGAGARAEVWDAARYQQYAAKKAKPAFEKIAQEMGI
ncbi:MAG: division/cell wall cluster transcriptional repressor MraZ [Elusimicrobia bacterium]|nr:division/cell wall cluster transcriptional repressor MraZ [Elusimicrobiota bacterium]